MGELGEVGSETKYSRPINELVNQRLINYRKSGKLKRRREVQSDERRDQGNAPGQMKMPWQPERPSWDNH